MMTNDRLGCGIDEFLDHGNSFLVLDERENTYKQITAPIPGLTLAGKARDSVIKIDDPRLICGLRIYMEGSNHSIHIGGFAPLGSEHTGPQGARYCESHWFAPPGTFGHFKDAKIHVSTHHCAVDIGRGIGACSVLMQCDSPYASITIGEGVWLAGLVALIASDTSPIIEKDSGAVRNSREGMPSLTIGDRCWIGKRATLLKGTVLPADTMVGAGSVVTGSFAEENTLIAGNPATVRAKHISWTRSWYDVSLPPI